MVLSPGTRLGAFEILALVGAGGMGEVYRARDTRLDRTVALKILRDAGIDAAGATRLERFRQEARAVARITHPNICTLHDVCQEGATTFLVMELVEGTTLAHRLEEGPLPLAVALKIAVQIADALDHAHHQGVIHRDLKPANIMLARDRVKLLDFGLAKLKEPDARSAALATTATGLTDARTIVGTPPYMAPEQIDGREVDARTDLFAFGVVLYEMIAGRRPFGGDSPISVLAAIVTAEPAPLAGLQPGTPPFLDRLVRRCLAKDPEDRWQSARDLGAELRWIAESGSAGDLVAPPATTRPRKAVAWAAAIAVVLVAAGLVVARLRVTPATAAAVTRFTIAPPDGGAIATAGTGRSPVAVSPDGRHIAILVTRPGEARQLYVRRLDGVGVRPLLGTADALDMFWSPDSQSIGFFARGKLQRISIAGGEPQTICDAIGGGGATWNRDGVILFTPRFQGTGVHRVSAAGGTPTPVTKFDAARETAHLWPWFLPDGTHFLFAKIAGEASGLYVSSLDSGEPKLLVRMVDFGAGDVPTPPAFAPPGYLLSVRRGVLMAQALDVERLELAGDLFRVAEGIDTNDGPWAAYSVSQTGVLAYWSRGFDTTQLAWVDRTGRSTGTVGAPGAYTHIALSPDGTRVALDIAAPVAGLWVLDIARGAIGRLAPDILAYSPVWSPDGDAILYAAAVRDTPPTLFLRRLSVSDEPERLDHVHTLTQHYPTHWSRDGLSAVYVTYDPKTRGDLWMMPVSGDRTPTLILQTPANEYNARISPDGRWIAYVSDESGRYEVYVTSFPRPGRKWLVSVNGATSPIWSRNGRELFYLAASADRTLMAVPFSTSPGFEPGAPVPLFESRAVRVAGRGEGWPYDVAADGRFLVNRVVERSLPPLAVVLNWLTDVGKE